MLSVVEAFLYDSYFPEVHPCSRRSVSPSFIIGMRLEVGCLRTSLCPCGGGVPGGWLAHNVLCHLYQGTNFPGPGGTLRGKLWKRVHCPTCGFLGGVSFLGALPLREGPANDLYPKWPCLGNRSFTCRLTCNHVAPLWPPWNQPTACPPIFEVAKLYVRMHSVQFLFKCIVSLFSRCI